MYNHYICPPAWRIRDALNVDMTTAARVRRVWKTVAQGAYSADEAYHKEINALQEIEPELMDQFRADHHYLMPAETRAIKQWLIDQLLETHGVEYLGIHRNTDHNVVYCNSGDTYITTAIFIGPRLVLGCWGDLVETNAVQ